MKMRTGLFLFIICSYTLCSAQQTISTAGGEANGAGGSVSYTIGQLAYTTLTQSEGTVSQGVQQPYEISVIPSGADKYGINLALSVYPNPVKEYLILKVVNFQSSNLKYHLYDMNGRLLQNKEIMGAETIIPMDMLPPSIYFLKVINNKKEVKIFKIVKN